MTATPHRRRRRLTSSLTFTALLAGTAISGTAGAAYAAGAYDVPHTDYELVAVSSESDPYPAPPAIDGTALAAFDGDFQSQWTSRYADEAPYPHWISLDLGQTLPLTAADYAVKPGQNGAAGEVAVYVTNSATVAAEEDPTAWGEPVGTATLDAPETAETRQRVDFDTPVEGRYLRFQLNSGLVEDAPAGSAAEIIAVSSEPVPEIVDQPEITDFETVELVNGDLTATVATEFPQVVAYTVGGEPFAGRESLLDTWTVNGQDYSASTTSTVEGATATYTSAVEDLGVEITSTITVTDEATVAFAVTDVTGDVQVNTLGIPGHSLLSATSATDGVELDRTTISPDSTQNADQYLPITATTAVDDDPVGAHTAFLVNGPVVGGVETNATVEARNQNSWNQRLLTQISGTEERTATIASNSWVYEPSAGQDPAPPSSSSRRPPCTSPVTSTVTVT
ncbi:discoidin domain-containing protein [Ruania alba]|uniref:F5/8 type C domain-containing protein n=1 Tax=Ruania alba TaxID=648782 RepID=A0A1H5DC29_9MICO|nr:discoidin domain-containing protein [Ruania alba]SED76338.1 F5/8 type C domain-containing protein [Ruania alba]